MKILFFKFAENNQKKAWSFIGFMLVYCLVFSGVTQNTLPSNTLFHDIAISTISSDTIISKDSTLSILIRASNNGRYIEEATITVTDSATGDTVEQWFPLFAPQSMDSTFLFWNTKGEKSGVHTLQIRSEIALDDIPENNVGFHKVKILP